MVNCAVPSCKNDSRRQTKQNSNVTFHRFPKREDLLQKWVDALKRANWEPTIRSFVCSDHFSPSAMFLSKRGLRKLVPDAVPEFGLTEEVSKKKKKKHIIIPHMYVARDSDKKKRESEPVKTEINEKIRFNEEKLKKRIVNLTKLAKRRRLRCNALYAGLNRIKKKVNAVTHAMKDLQEKISVNQELSDALESCGVSNTDLFKGLWKREKSCSPEPQDDDDCFYSELPNEIENFVDGQTSPQKPMMMYTITLPANYDDNGRSPSNGGVDSVVKKEIVLSPRVTPAGIVLDLCRICLVGDVKLIPISEDLRDVYERLTTTKLEDTDCLIEQLCAECYMQLQTCRRFADMAMKAEGYHDAKGAETNQAKDPVDVKVEAVNFGVSEPAVNAWTVNVGHIGDDSD